MMFKKIVSGLFGLGLAAMMGVAPAAAAEDGGTPHYPIHHPHQVDWSFAGVFGKWDLGQLQRGFKIYRENCSSCHSMDLVAFRNLADLGFSEQQVKAIAAEYEITDGPNADGEMFDRPGVPADRFPSPFANAAEAAASNNGAAPPDFSLLAKARAPERGFPTFIFDIFTGYAENGPDYIYSLLTGYEDTPAGKELSEGTYYNTYFAGGDALAMAPPLFEEAVEYTDGTPMTVDQYAKDVSAFMMWAAEPNLIERKSLGFKVLVFLLLFAALLYLTKKKIWSNLTSEGVSSGDAQAGNSQAMSLVAAGAGASVASGTSTSAKPSAPKKAAAPKKTAAAPKKVAATKKAASVGPERLSKPNGKADDLKLIAGVGPKLEKTLNGLGFWHFAQIAKWTKKDVAIVDDELSFKGRIDRDDWIKQAKALAKGGRDEYVRVFGKEPR